MRSLLLVFILTFIGCRKPEKIQDPAIFSESPVSVPLNPGLADEVSGIADSKSYPGHLWVQEDSGNPPELHLLAYDGTIKKSVFVDGAINRDWEDMIIAPGPIAGLNYIYVADIGDNSQHQDEYFIYRFPEPQPGVDTVTNPERITFRYPDGPHDAEAIVADLSTKDIYIITKRDQVSGIYKLSYPQIIAGVQTATWAGSLSFSGVVSAAVSPDNKEILIKTYLNIYHWKRSGGKSIEEALKDKPVTVSYKPEPQGEALCFRNDNSGFFTLSEKGIAIGVALNLYRRN